MQNKTTQTQNAYGVETERYECGRSMKEGCCSYLGRPHEGKCEAENAAQ